MTDPTPVLGEDGLNWTFAGRAAGEPMEAWLDRVHPVSYDTDDGPFLRCPTCEEWSPCDVRTGIVALTAAADPTPAPPAGPVLGEEALQHELFEQSIRGDLVPFVGWDRLDGVVYEIVTNPHLAALVAAAEQRGAAAERDRIAREHCEAAHMQARTKQALDDYERGGIHALDDLYRALLDGPS